MDAIEYALNELHAEISPEALRMAFAPNTQYAFSNSYSIEEVIRDKVIEARVIPGMDTNGGQEIDIDIEGTYYLQELGVHYFHIPLEKTQGRHILSAFAITYGLEGNAYLGKDYENVTNQLNNQIQGMQSYSGTGNIEIAGPNVLAIRDYVPDIYRYLRGRIANDPNLQNVDRAYYDDIAELVMNATKAYIYTHYRTPLSQGHINAGAPNDVLLSEIDDFRESRILYKENLRDWGKKSIMQDRQSHRRLMRMTMG